MLTVRLTTVKIQHTIVMFQSTHSRGVRRTMERGEWGKGEVSIHALTRSATSRLGGCLPVLVVSIHALTRSATNYGTVLYMSYEEFQSTHSRGVRPHIFFLFYFQIFRTRFSRIFLKNIKSKR